MGLRLPDDWVWDFWLADTGDEFHLFFLHAPRSLGAQVLRHRSASVGHAVSYDLVTWEVREIALARRAAPAFDDVATWTGSVVAAPSGDWHMFYTGAGSPGEGLVQRIGVATSSDLTTWRPRAESLVVADGRWYVRLGDSSWFDEAWRDPWVFADPGGDGWHMLITARANHGPVDDRGVIGHVRSSDLEHWEVQPPLSEPGAGFGYLEVPQVEVVDGRPVLLFSCLRGELTAARRATGSSGGVWWVATDAVVGPYPTVQAQPLTDATLYSGRLVRARGGRWVLLTFHNFDDGDAFVGELSDPMPVGWDAAGQLVLDGDAVTSRSARPTASSRDGSA